MTNVRQRVAIIIPGGIGTGKNDNGVPVLGHIVELLSKKFSITVFQLFPANPDFIPRGFELICVYSRNPFIKVVKFFIAFWRKRSLGFSVVHGLWSFPCGTLAVITGVIFGINSFVSILGGDTVFLPTIRYGQMRNRFYKWTIFWTLKKADETIALTRYLVNNLRVTGLVNDRIHLIPWGIDTTIFSFKEKREIGTPVRFLHIANITPVKDQETLLRAFTIIKDQIPAELTMIGEGDAERTVRALIKELKLEEQVKVINPMPYQDLPEHYHRADVLLHTSRSEGQSEVVTEAMSCGVLVCGTRVGLLFDQQNCCVAVDVGDYKALARETLQVLKDAQRMETLRHRAKEWSETHSVFWTVDEIGKLYRCHA